MQALSVLDWHYIMFADEVACKVQAGGSGSELVLVGEQTRFNLSNLIQGSKKARMNLLVNK